MTYLGKRDTHVRNIVSLLTLFLYGVLHATPEKDLHSSIASLIDQPKFSAMSCGMVVVSSDGNVLFERDADRSLIPASTMKLVTTATALGLLGPDFKVRTSVYASCPLYNGILHGDLILYGRGDPTLSSRFEGGNPYSLDSLLYQETNPYIEQLADQIKMSGVKLITGSIIGDESFFSTRWLGPGWECDDAQAWYASEISALSVNDNCYSLVISPAAIGKAPLVKVMPSTAYVKIMNNAETVTHGQTAIGITRPLNSNTIEVFGMIPHGSKELKVTLAVHQPALFAATLLKEALGRRGIRVIKKVSSADVLLRMKSPTDFSQLKEIAHLTSQPLSIMIKRMNKVSQNLYAELLLRQLGIDHETTLLDQYGRPQAVEMKGNDMRRSFLEAAGIDTQHLKLHDGSGLARHNLLTPRAVAQLLQYMLGHIQSAVFQDSLPIAGIDGTLEKRMNGTSASQLVRAKTGTLGGVSALSGYSTTKKGKIIIFSFMVNNYTGSVLEITALFDQICVLLADFQG